MILKNAKYANNPTAMVLSKDDLGKVGRLNVEFAETNNMIGATAIKL